MSENKGIAEKVSITSGGINQTRLEVLKQLVPEAFTEGKIDFDKLRQTLGEFVDDSPERYTFTWAGKRDAVKLLQSPTAATLVPDRDESINFDDTSHIFIEGENLEALKLLYKAYFGKVKLIYIDPPYNTGNDFVYPDNYADPLGAYLQLTGQTDAVGNLMTSNTDSSGRFHSNWLTMMYPRLFVARQLLREDGAIFISIDDNEIHNLRNLMNEVFGEENFIAQITVQSNPRGRQAENFVATVHEYVLVFSKNIASCSLAGMPLNEEQLAEFGNIDEKGNKYRLLGLRQRGSASRREDRPQMFFPIYVDPETSKVSLTQSGNYSERVLPRKSTGEDGRWMWGKNKVQEELSRIEGRWIQSREEWDIYIRDYLIRADGESRTRKFKTIWNEKQINYQDGTRELKDIFETNCALLDYPKPVYLIEQIITMASSGAGSEIFMDFFAGSCTFAQAVLESNRKDNGNRRFIVVQLPELLARSSPPQKMGYETISDVGRMRISRVVNKIRSQNASELIGYHTTDLGMRVFKLAQSHFKSWSGSPDTDPDIYNQQLSLFRDPLIEGWQPEAVIWEVALKEGYPLHSRVTQATVAGHIVYRITNVDNEQQFHICLESQINADLPRQLGLNNQDLFICRDIALDDSAAANLALQCHLKTI
jgi:adenine-specific DNA-methyltransferase